jgi:Putative polyhydroxyalkanoic acid system protein (PHA_gran_rgn)
LGRCLLKTRFTSAESDYTNKESMMPTFTVSLATQLSQEETRRRIQELLATPVHDDVHPITNLGWDGNQLDFTAMVRGSEVLGQLCIADGQVEITAHVPWRLAFFDARVKQTILDYGRRLLLIR